jgi:hypothetical protein
VLVNLFSWMHYLSWETQPAVLLRTEVASLSALRWLEIAVISISAIAYFSKAVLLPIAALALNVCQSILLLGVTALCYYGVWRRHTEKT